MSIFALSAVAGPSLPKGPEAWLEFVDGNVRKDGLRLDLESLRDAGISGVHFFHIGGGVRGARPSSVVAGGE